MSIVAGVGIVNPTDKQEWRLMTGNAAGRKAYKEIVRPAEKRAERAEAKARAEDVLAVRVYRKTKTKELQRAVGELGRLLGAASTLSDRRVVATLVQAEALLRQFIGETREILRRVSIGRLDGYNWDPPKNGKNVNSLIEQLPPRDAEIIRLRHGLFPYMVKHTFTQIGARLDISRQRAEQICGKALETMRERAKEDGTNMADFMEEENDIGADGLTKNGSPAPVKSSWGRDPMTGDEVNAEFGHDADDGNFENGNSGFASVQFKDINRGFGTQKNRSALLPLTKVDIGTLKM